MKQKRILSDYSLSDYPELILDVIEKRVKLTAVIQQQPDLYFLPETVLDSDELNTFEDVQERISSNMRQPADTGKYEMTDNSWIVKELELLQENCLHSKSLVLKGLKSPDGVIGYFRNANRHGLWEPELARIKLTLIYVEDNHSMDQMNECLIGTPEHQVMVAVHNEFWADGKGAPQEAIRTWIRDKFKDLKLGNNRKLGNSKTKIEYIERFCRPKNRRTGH